VFYQPPPHINRNPSIKRAIRALENIEVIHTHKSSIPSLTAKTCVSRWREAGFDL